MAFISSREDNQLFGHFHYKHPCRDLDVYGESSTVSRSVSQYSVLLFSLGYVHSPPEFRILQNCREF